jgi:molybdate transport system permease protein
LELDPLALSFQIAAVATCLAGALGVALAAMLANARFAGRDVLDGLFTTPMVLPPTVLGYYLLVVLGQRSALGAAFHALTGSTIVFTKTGAIVAATIGAIPFVVKSGRAALEGVDATLVQAARTLGASTTRAFFTVQLPLARRGVIAGLMLGFARSIGDFGMTLMVAGDFPGRTRTASLAIYDAVQANRDADALRMSAVLTALVVGVLYIANKLTARSGDAG